MTKRLTEMREALLTALPAGGTALHHEEVNRLAELRLAAELMRAQVIGGRRANVEKLIRLEELVNRLTRALGLDQPPKQKARLPWELLADKAAAPNQAPIQVRPQGPQIFTEQLEVLEPFAASAKKDGRSFRRYNA